MLKSSQCMYSGKTDTHQDTFLMILEREGKHPVYRKSFIKLIIIIKLVFVFSIRKSIVML